MIHRLTDNNGPYDTILFDMDGTLIESGPGIMKAVRHMFGKMGITETDEARIQAFIGPPIIHHLKNVYGLSDADAHAAYGHYRAYYDANGILECGLYPGIEGVLRTLKESGKTLYVATSKPEEQAHRMLKRTGVLDFFTRIFGAVHLEGVYTKDEVLVRATTQLGGTPPHAVMIGDRSHDILGGQHVGLDTIGVLYGYGSYDEFKEAGCDMIAERPSDLLSLLMEEDR